MKNIEFLNTVKYLEYDNEGDLIFAAGVIRSKKRIKEIDKYIRE